MIWIKTTDLEDDIYYYEFSSLEEAESFIENINDEYYERNWVPITYEITGPPSREWIEEQIKRSEARVAHLMTKIQKLKELL